MLGGAEGVTESEREGEGGRHEVPPPAMGTKAH